MHIIIMMCLNLVPPYCIYVIIVCRHGVSWKYFSGADDIPPLGFPHEPELNFNSTSVYPTASTCAIQLMLPSQYSNYEDFKLKLDQAFTMHGGFGLT